MNKEIWRDIPGFKDLYQASTLGRIRNKAKVVKQSYFSGPGGYYKVDLYKGGKRTKARVNRMIAATFLGDICGKEVNHLDFNRLNNTVSNLQICTKSENAQHALRNGRKGTAKLSPSMVMSIRKMYDNHTSRKVIANLLGVHPTTITNIVTAKSWRHV